MLMFVASVSLYAQSFPYYTQFTPQSVEVEYYADIEESYNASSKGQGLYDAGRALMTVGGMLTAIGVNIIVVNWATYEPSERDYHEVNLAPLFGMFYGGAGISLALIGLPLFLAGKNVSVQNNGSLMTFGVNSKGWGGIFKLGAGVSKSIALGGDFIYGYHFNRNIFLGGGVGYEWNLNMNSPSAPIYLHTRFSLGNRSVAPYLGLSLGYDNFNKAECYGCDVGVRIQKIKHSNRLVTWWISHDSKMIVRDKLNTPSITFKVARSF